MRLQFSLEHFRKIYNLALIVNNSFIAKENKDNIYLKCEDYHLFSGCTDGLITVKLKLSESDQLKILEEGIIFVNSKLIIKIFETLNQKKTTSLINIFTIEDNSFNIFCNDYKCNNIPFVKDKEIINDDFIFNDHQQIEFDLALLQVIYDRFKDFVKTSNHNNDRINSAIYGINLAIRNNQLEVCSTDAFSVAYGKFPDFIKENFEFNIFPDTLHKIIWLLEKNSTVTLFISEDNIIIRTNELSIKARLINAKYPSFLHWFEKPSEHRILINNKSELISKMSGLYVDPDQKYRIINLEINDNKLTIKNKDFTCLQVEDHLIINNDLNTNFRLALDYDRFVNLIRKIKDDKISLEFVSENKPVIIRSLEKDSNYQQIIIPSRIY